MKYIAKPNLNNNNGRKEFDDAYQAVKYLNETLTDKGVDAKFEYTFVLPSTSKTQLKHAVDEYVGIGKLIVLDDSTS